MVELVSGAVPRELIPGVVWCEKAEAEFVEFATGFLRKQGNKAECHEIVESSIREARWAVEIRLHQRFCKARVVEANRCSSNVEKRAVIAKWRQLYGDERSSRLQRMVRDEKLNKTIVEKW